MDLTKMCNLEKVFTKYCLKLVIDNMDEDVHIPKNIVVNNSLILNSNVKLFYYQK